MPLTRHFYEADEVQSALYYCASRRDLKECEFWCHEMLCSGYESEAVSTLFESWLWQRGPFCMSWLIDVGPILHQKRSGLQPLGADTVTHEDIMGAASLLSSFGEWDNSLWSVLTCDLSAVDRVTPKTPAFVPVGCSDKVLYLYRAIYQGKACSAWAIVQIMVKHLAKEKICSLLKEYGSHVSAENAVCFMILQNYEKLLGYKSDAYDTVILCMAVLMLCLSDKKRGTSFMRRVVPPRMLTIPVGTKAARMYSVPSVALYGTKRGLSLCSQYHIHGLYDIEKAIKGCPFWDSLLKEYQRQGKWVSDDAMEAFYEEYFPDDIPDEWSKEEKMKSHGQGLLNKGEKMTLARYARIHFTKPSRLAFGVKGRKLDGIEGCSPLDAIRLDDSVEILLKPVRRKYII